MATYAPLAATITEEQYSMIVNLLHRLGRSGEAIPETAKEASTLIRQLKAAQAAAGIRHTLTEPTLPDGLYAVRVGSEVRRYRLATYASGKWAGRQYVRRVGAVGRGGWKVGRNEAYSVKTVIERDPEAARNLFEVAS